MRQDALGASEALAHAHAQAQAEALRLFGDEPATPWQPRLPMRAAARWTLLAFATGGAVVWMLGTAAAPADASAMAMPAASVRVDVAQEDDIVDAEPLPIQGAWSRDMPTRQAVAPASLVVERFGATWRIDAVNVSRLDAARRLAQLSDSPLLGATDLIARARPLDLRWQGRDLADAWKAVLGPNLNYALQCRRDRCQAWIVAAAEPGANLSLALPSAPSALVPQGVDAPSRNDAGDLPDRIHHD